jgi:glycosidase
MTKSQYSLGVKRLKLAYTALSTLPGIPAIFYGDEAGLEGYSDPFNRMPFPWGKEDQELLEHYKTLGNIRRKNAIYKAGEFSLLHLDDSLLIFSRYDKGRSFVTVINSSDKAVNLKFTTLTKPQIGGGRTKKDFEILPMASEIFKLKTGDNLEFTR